MSTPLRCEQGNPHSFSLRSVVDYVSSVVAVVGLRGRSGSLRASCFRSSSVLEGGVGARNLLIVPLCGVLISAGQHRRGTDGHSRVLRWFGVIAEFALISAAGVEVASAWEAKRGPRFVYGG